ncbi:MAG: response regulator [Leptospirales bacterium]|nr:response regulator [Leptospirales bacterium]
MSIPETPFFAEDFSQYELQHFQFSPLPILRFSRSAELIKCSASANDLTGYNQDELISQGSSVLKTIFIYDSERIKNAINEIFDGRQFYRKDEIKIASKYGERLACITIYPIRRTPAETDSVEMIIEDITELRSLKEKINAVNRLHLLRDITNGFLHYASSSINNIMDRTQFLMNSTLEKNITNVIIQIETEASNIAVQAKRIQNSIAQKGYFYEERLEPLVTIINDAIEFSNMRLRVETEEKRRKISIEKSYLTDVSIMTNGGLLREIIISLILRLSASILKAGSIKIELLSAFDIQLSLSVAKNNINQETIQMVQLSGMVNAFSGIDIHHSAEKIGLKLFVEESAEIYSIKMIFPQRLIGNHKKNQHAAAANPEGHNIIIAEPDDALKKILTDLFLKMNNTVFTCKDGNEALAEFKKNPYTIVISNYDVSGITGIELAARVKELNEEALTVVLSSWKFDDMSAYKNVADLIVSKPFALNSLIEELSQALVKKTKRN